MSAFLMFKIELVARVHVKEFIPGIRVHEHAVDTLAFQVVNIIACAKFISTLRALQK